MVESISPAVPRSDAELIAAVAQGDETAYATIRERHVAAARILARQLVDGRAKAEELVSQTFARLHDVLRQGNGPADALRPYLLTAVRRVAAERESETGAADAQIPNLGEPLCIDPAAAELENTPLARSYMSLPERQRGVLWHTVIEQADPADVAALLGLTSAGLTALGQQSRLVLHRAYLKLNLSGLSRDDCRETVAPLGEHLAGVASAADQGKVERHLRACRDCRAAAVELGSLTESLRRAVAPIFLGPAAEAYLAAAEAKGASAGQILGGLRWMRQAPRRMTETPRQRRVLVAGAALVALFGFTGLSLTLAAGTGPRSAQQPVAAAIQPPGLTSGAPSPSAAPAPTTTKPRRSAPPLPAPARSPSPTSRSPRPASSSPSPTRSPSPPTLPTLPPPPADPPPQLHHHHHRHKPL